MWGAAFILLSLSGAPQSAPHPATLRPYRPPTVQPYQPPSAFEREVFAEGDLTDARGPMLRMGPISATEPDYDAAVIAREVQADAPRGALDGEWRLVDQAGREVAMLSLVDTGQGVEGGWRRGGRFGAATADGTTITLEGWGNIALSSTSQPGVRHGRLNGRAISMTRLP